MVPWVGQCEPERGDTEGRGEKNKDLGERASDGERREVAAERQCAVTCFGARATWFGCAVPQLLLCLGLVGRLCVCMRYGCYSAVWIAGMCRCVLVAHRFPACGVSYGVCLCVLLHPE